QVLPQIRFVRLDISSLLDDVLVDPSDFGLANVEDSCLAFGVVRGAVCERPDGYLFWDGEHPTRAGHHIIARAALHALSPVVASCGGENGQ
ncbi:MAG TPA: hypothetical protein VKB36_17645, partial [Vicinamibacterales bacterium]|nr:hypothetical protein [Vicinamibacterales bacterium]